MKMGDEESLLNNEQEEVIQTKTSGSKVPGFVLTGLAIMATVLFTSKAASLRAFGPSDLASIKHELHTQRLGYDAIVAHTLDIYSIDYVVEPDTTMVLKVTTCDNCGDVSWSIKPTGERGSVSYDVTSTSSTLHALFKEANAEFSIQASVDGQLIIDETATCKYVRRELRSVNAKDQTRFMLALKEMYSIDQEEGEEKYGKNFLASQHLVALHDTGTYHFHGNLFFFTSHPALQVKFEKSILSIDSGLVLAYWDFMKDSDLGHDWDQSEIYSESLFGPVATLKENDYRVSGYFHDVKMVFDPDSRKFPNAGHTPRGYLGALTQTTSSKHLQRSNSYCGFRSTMGQVAGTNFVACMDQYEDDHNFRQLDVCFEEKVHANLHMMHAGQWDCSVDWGDFYEEHKVWLDKDLLSMMAVLMSSSTINFRVTGDVSCPSSCSGDESCSCKSSMDIIKTPSDVDELSRSKRMTLIKSAWTSIRSHSVGSDEYVQLTKSYDMDGTTYSNVFLPLHSKGPNADHLPMDNTKLDLLNRLMLKTILFQGSYGIMMTGAAPTDPLFWVMHPIFDKATHALRLSPRYSGDGFVWNNMKGFEKFESMTPFTRLDFEPYLGAGTKTKGPFLKNSELWEILHPASESIYYIYDQFTEWGNTAFDPFATGSDESSSSE
mmetsp:Transcript_30581/g.39422  ORF Transcript_30581/g.39422 Transcript_30581/m.39422 type:complete len:661 (+) Transcript_30581:40-2022(+)